LFLELENLEKNKPSLSLFIKEKKLMNKKEVIQETNGRATILVES
jgi:hypothetical protein